MDMTILSNGQLTSDRFNNSNWAMMFSTGYGSVPSGYYFDPSTGFSIMAWIKVFTFISVGNERISNNQKCDFFFNFSILILKNFQVDFGSGRSDNVILDISPVGILEAAILKGTSILNILDSNTTIVLNQWTHVAISFDVGTVNMYMNGKSVGFKSGFLMQKVLRTTSFIGHSNWGELDVNAIFDEIKIFNRI